MIKKKLSPFLRLGTKITLCLFASGTLILRPTQSQQVTYADFGKIAAEYVNYCYGIDYLNERYCDKSSKKETKSCIALVSRLVDPSISDQVQQLMTQSLQNHQRRATYENQLNNLFLLAKSSYSDSHACKTTISVFESSKLEAYQKAAQAAKSLPGLTLQR
jgi:hypothetical protein